MKDGENNNSFRFLQEMDRKGKPPDNPSPNGASHFAKDSRLECDGQEHCVNRRLKFQSKSGAFSFLPSDRFFEFNTGDRSEDNVPAHCLSYLASILDFICCQESTSVGFVRWSARRRSSSVV